jgi:hypothetical protein
VTLSGDEWTTLVLRVAAGRPALWRHRLVAKITLGELKALAEDRAKPERDESWQLVVLDGPGDVVGRRWPLLPLTTIGRTPKNTVSIDDPYLSGEHAEIVRESGAWWVRDKGSTNGTLLKWGCGRRPNRDPAGTSYNSAAFASNSWRASKPEGDSGATKDGRVRRQATIPGMLPFPAPSASGTGTACPKRCVLASRWRARPADRRTGDCRGALILLLLTTALLVLRSAHADRVYPAVVVADVAVGGLSSAEAATALRAVPRPSRRRSCRSRTAAGSGKRR